VLWWCLPASIELDTLPARDDPRTILIVAIVPTVGRVTWLPALKIKCTEHIADIIRETFPFGGAKLHREPVMAQVADEIRKRGFPPKPECQLYPGRPSY